MIRTQVSLTAEQMRRLHGAAKRRGVSMASIVREAVDRELGSEPPERDALWDRAFGLVGKGRDRNSRRDVASRHDDYLKEALTPPGAG